MSNTASMRRPRRWGWNMFPVWLVIAMGTVMAVNARFVTIAFTTFPGIATADDFDTSNDYNRILSGVERQNALGWRVRADESAAVLTIVLADRQGRPLPAATVQAVARRPLGDDPDMPVMLTETSSGRFVLGTALRGGQWDLLLHISAEGQEMRVARRVLVR
jgi:nitrogen fixation protein FixH